MANKWRYECDCNNCEKVKRIVDPEKHMNGDYCTATVAGLKTIHADDDYVIRCDQYEPKMEQIAFSNLIVQIKCRRCECVTRIDGVFSFSTQQPVNGYIQDVCQGIQLNI